MAPEEILDERLEVLAAKADERVRAPGLDEDVTGWVWSTGGSVASQEEMMDPRRACHSSQLSSLRAQWP